MAKSDVLNEVFNLNILKNKNIQNYVCLSDPNLTILTHIVLSLNILIARQTIRLPICVNINTLQANLYLSIKSIQDLKFLKLLQTLDKHFL